MREVNKIMAKSKKEINKELMFNKLMPTGESRHTVAPNIKNTKPYDNSAELEKKSSKKIDEMADDKKELDEHTSNPISKVEAKKAIVPIEESDKIIHEQENVKAEDTPIKKQVETIMVNIRERMVMEKLDEALEKFKCCTCFFCRQDVMTMALNSLQPKYIVTTKADIDTIIENENYEEVTQAIMKAILQVKQHPRH